MEEGTLLKLTTKSEAIVYKVIGSETTAVKVVEVCRIGGGKMTLNYSNKVETYIYQSELSHTYKQVRIEEMNRIIKILSDSLKEVGF